LSHDGAGGEIAAACQTVNAPSSSAIPSASRYAWYVLIALTLTYGFNFVDRYVFIIMMEPMKKDLGLSDTQLGLTSGLAFSLI
jgi:sugar phosphate permease